jgi:ABC-type multidrug transport system ATPase subunit
MLRVAGLSKRYGRTLALDRLDLDIPDGSVFGLLGPNGSGKSTFIKLLLGFIFPDAGEIDLGGLPPARIGYLPERPFFPMRSPLDEYLLTAGQLGGLKGAELHAAVAARLRQVGLSNVAGRRINTCSRGMLQRLALAASLLENPALLLWDEPLSGLDPAWQKAVRDLIKSVAAQGVTVVLSTHDLSDVEQVCTHLGILYRGRLVRHGALSEVLATQPEVSIAVDHLPADLAATLGALDPGITPGENCILLRGAASGRKAEVLQRLLADGIDIQRVSQARATLEDIYMESIRS